ncbi:MAG: class I SAM-dependent methyltransferase [Chloroflexi bacterium]|nr:class I SAM-dependent methyltransferase [Chloroflexota bacterium]
MVTPDESLPPLERFAKTYQRVQSAAAAVVEREVFGGNFGVHGYTTIEQADALATHLDLRAATRLLDIGSFRGWPSLYLAGKTGCEAVLTDLPAEALADARGRARRLRVEECCSFVTAAGEHLPFRPDTFDAIVHTDAL